MRRGAASRAVRAAAPVIAGDQRGDIILGWLVRLVAVLGLLGVVGFDAMAIGWTHAALPDQASSAARAASEEWQASRHVQLAYNAAVRHAGEDHAANVIDPASFGVGRDGTVRLRVDRTVDTLVLRHLSPIRGWAFVSSEGVGRYVD